MHWPVMFDVTTTSVFPLLKNLSKILFGTAKRPNSDALQQIKPDKAAECTSKPLVTHIFPVKKCHENSRKKKL